MMKLTLFMKSWCPWCIAARERLDAMGFAYEMVDIEANPEARKEMERLSGQSLTPVLVAPGGAVLADFGPEELDGFFQRNNIRP